MYATLSKLPQAERLAKMPLERACWTCKQMLPASRFYKGDTLKYWNCKVCEAARHRQRTSAGQSTTPDCPTCKTGMNQRPKKTRLEGFDFYECPCGVLMRFKRRTITAANSERYYTGKQFCDTCNAYNPAGRHSFNDCLQVRTKLQKKIRRTCDLDDSLSSEDEDVRATVSTLSQRIDAILNTLD
jgi:hypothetical protein